MCVLETLLETDHSHYAISRRWPFTITPSWQHVFPTYYLILLHTKTNVRNKTTPAYSYCIPGTLALRLCSGDVNLDPLNKFSNTLMLQMAGESLQAPDINRMPRTRPIE